MEKNTMLATTIVFTMPVGTDWNAMRATARQRAQELYLDVPGLVSKAFVINPERNLYGGCYIWQSQEALDDFLQSPTFQGAKAKFGEPDMQIFEIAAFVDHGILAD